jgi:hypothetical protein
LVHDGLHNRECVLDAMVKLVDEQLSLRFAACPFALAFINRGGSAGERLAHALHELATNAAKYGSLSNGSGAVDIAWEIVPAPESSFLDTRLKRTGAGANDARARRRSDFSDWLFGANISEEIVAAPLWHSLFALGLLGAAAIALSALLAALFGATFTAAAAELARQATALGAGEPVAPTSSRLAELERVLAHAVAPRDRVRRCP